MRRETPAFAQQKWPGGTLYHYGLCELAQRQAVLMRKDIPSDRAIKSDRAKVVMTAGCISKNFDISNYIYILREIGNSTNQNLSCVQNRIFTHKKTFTQMGKGFNLNGDPGGTRTPDPLIRSQIL